MYHTLACLALKLHRGLLHLFSIIDLQTKEVTRKSLTFHNTEIKAAVPLRFSVFHLKFHLQILSFVKLLVD